MGLEWSPSNCIFNNRSPGDSGTEFLLKAGEGKRVEVGGREEEGRSERERDCDLEGKVNRPLMTAWKW